MNGLGNPLTKIYDISLVHYYQIRVQFMCIGSFGLRVSANRNAQPKQPLIHGAHVL